LLDDIPDETLQRFPENILPPQEFFRMSQTKCLPASRFLADLEGFKSRFSAEDAAGLASLLEQGKTVCLDSAEDLIRFHEALLFFLAYPSSRAVAALARELLSGISRTGAALRHRGIDLTMLEEPEVSGIAGTGITAVFCHAVATRLASDYPGDLAIAWNAYEDQAPLGWILPSLMPMCDEDALVEAHVPYADWLRAAARNARAELGWLLAAIRRVWPDEREQADRYDALQLPLRWEFRDNRVTRSHVHLRVRRLFLHEAPLIRRSEVSLEAIPRLDPLPVRTLPRREGTRMIDLAIATSAVRYRQLHGFHYGDPEGMREVHAGRGVVFFISGLLAAHRLPLRAYHAATIWKNGIPLGYFEGLSLFERMEAGFNLYYTFRDGETAWIYRQLLQTFYQLLGITCFILDPYQIGHGNEEAIESGAFWFYRKLGFRSVSAEGQTLTTREEGRIAARPGYRSSPAILRRLVAHPMVYELPGTERGAWDRFQTRTLALAGAANRTDRGLAALARDAKGWTQADRRLLGQITRAKNGPDEARYLQLMRRHTKLREAVLRLGSLPAGFH
jgi:hypothetical protein